MGRVCCSDGRDAHAYKDPLLSVSANLPANQSIVLEVMQPAYT